jgi:predicted permease
VVLIGHGVWQNRYGSALDVVGRVVRIDGKPATIIGVMPEGFKFPNNENLWMPLVPDADLEKRTSHNLELFALLRPGITVAGANADLDVIAGRIAAEFPDSNKDLGALVRTFHETYNGDQIKIVFLMMLGAVGFVLLIACANVANMMLSRAIGRVREIAVRAAMGATRWQIIRQLLVESVLLSSLGGLLGLGLSALGVHAFDLASRDVGKPYWVIFEMDWRAFAYFAALSVLSGIVFGLVPALRASRVDLNAAMKDGTPGGGSHRGRLTGALVVFQFALTVVLLAGAGLMIRSFFAAQALNSFVRQGRPLRKTRDPPPILRPAPARAPGAARRDRGGGHFQFPRPRRRATRHRDRGPAQSRPEAAAACLDDHPDTELPRSGRRADPPGPGFREDRWRSRQGGRHRVACLCRATLAG